MILGHNRAGDSWQTRLGSVLLVPLSVLLCAPASLSAGEDPDAGNFQIRTAYTELIDGVYYLNADVDYGLSPAALDALRSGVTLTIQLQMEVIRSRRWWPDAKEATLRQRYQLSYHPLSRRYVVENLNTGTSESFSSYRAAVTDLGRVSDLPVIDSALLDPDARYDIRMRIAIDVRDLPSPLNLVAFLFSEWDLTSEWYTWILRS